MTRHDDIHVSSTVPLATALLALFAMAAGFDDLAIFTKGELCRLEDAFNSAK